MNIEEVVVDEIVPVDVDASDPVVAALAWGFTEIVKRLVPDEYSDKVRPFLPLVALFVAVAARTIVALAMDEGLTFALFIRALAAAAVAVYSHSQIRGVQKFAKSRSKADK
jgi:hypothetical protein